MEEPQHLRLGYVFKHESFVREVDGLRFFGTNRITVLVAGGAETEFAKVCQITFHRGSVFVQFTYFGDVPGIVGVIDPVESSPGKCQMNLGATGTLAPSLVKYSHPPDGRAHFSQDGKIVTRIRRDSFPLSSGKGPMFELHAFQPTRFEKLAVGSERRDRLYAPFFFRDHMPDAINVMGMWWPGDQVRAMRHGSGPVIGPLEEITNFRTGGKFKAFLAAPRGPDPSHVLALALGPKPLPSGVTGPLLVFMGGWDADADARDLPGQCLACMYPTTNASGWAARLGTIGYPRAP